MQASIPVSPCQPRPWGAEVFEQFARGRSLRRSAVRSCLAALAMAAGMAAATPALADHDWIVNMNDTGSDPIPAGGVINYNVTVSNDGPDAAPASSVTITVPAGATLTGTTGGISSCLPLPLAGPGTATCPLPPLADGASVAFVVQMQTVSQQVLTAGISVPVAGDRDPANNAATETTTVTQGADVSLTVTGPATAAAGSPVNYTYTVQNNGPDAVGSVVVSFPVPEGLTALSPPSGCSLTAGTYRCTVPGPIAVGGSAQVVLGGQIAAASGSTVSMVASVGGGIPLDPRPENDAASFATAVTAGSDLSITKSRSPAGAVLVGDPVTFTLHGRYTGDSPNGLVITDTLPANYAIQSVTPAPGSGWTCSVAGQTVSCLRATGAGPGALVSLGQIQIVADTVSAGGPVNQATIAAGGPADPVPGNNTATDGGAVIMLPTVDLRADKTGPEPALMVMGQPYEFQMSAWNDGNSPFWGTAILTDTLPAGMTATGYNLPAGWNCAPAAPQAGPVAITCQRVYTPAEPLAAGDSTATLVITAEATVEGVLTNSLTVASPDGNIADANPGNNTATYTVTAATGGNSVDIEARKTALHPTVVAGDTQTYRIEVTNAAGPGASTAITLTDDLTGLINSATGPVDAGIVSMDVYPGIAAGMSCAIAPSGGTSARLTCTIPALPVCASGGDCPVVEVTVRPGGDGGARTNRARAISSEVPDPDLTNNTAEAGFAVTPRADVALFKQASPATATAGQNLTWLLTARNLPNGLSSAAGVAVADTLPHGLTFLSAVPSTGSCTLAPAAGSVTGPGNDQLACTLGTLGNGVQQTVLITVRPNTATWGTTLTNTAAVSTTTPEDNTANNSAVSAVDVEAPRVDLLVNKTDSIDPLTVGDDTVYTITVTNNGPSAAEDVRVIDTMPASGMTYQAHGVSGDGSCGTVPAVGSVGGTLECSFPVLLAGQTQTVTVTARGTAKGVRLNSVTVSSTEVAAGFETNIANNTETETTTVRTRADLEVVSKTAVPAVVNLNDDFEFVIRVRNNTGPGLAEADGVTVADTLPAGMRLVGTPTVTTLSGSLTTPECTGAALATSFECTFVSVSAAAEFEIRVPVEVVTVASLPATLTNSATVSTTGSFDPVPGNNTNSGNVTVASSSVAGQLFRDFDDDGVRDAEDTGVGGITLTLTGTSFDGQPVTRTVTTAANGSYVFPYLPEGTYQISRGTIAETYLNPGRSVVGTASGTAASATLIQNIALSAAAVETGYDFTVIPVARVGLAKERLSGPTINPDGSFVTTFRLRVRNFSLEPLVDVQVTDPLAGTAPLFGSHVALAAPATDPMALGTYTVLAAPTGNCGGFNASFNGAGDTTLASGVTIAAGATCTIDVTLRVLPTAPRPAGGYLNSATVTGTGALTGQNPGNNPQLTDVSHNGTNPDPNGNGRATDPGENAPTPVNPAYAPAVALVKTATLSGGTANALPGDTISYAFTVTNTGNVTLTGLAITEETLPGVTLSGGPIASLAPGASDSTTITATYIVTQDDIDAGEVVNSARVAGSDPFGTVVEDVSGTAATNDTPTVTPLPREVSLAVVKTADDSALNSPTRVGDAITYGFTLRNTGTVTLTGIALTDAKLGVTLTGGPIATLAPGAEDAATFTATYLVTQADIDAGEVVNTAIATGEGPQGQVVTDASGSDFDNDEPTVVPLDPAPAVALVKTADASALSDPPQAGEVVTYHFAITNTGNVTLHDLVIAEELLPGVALSGGPVQGLAPGDTDAVTITGTYALTLADLDAGEVVNSARVTGRDQLGTPVEDVSGTAVDNDDPTEVPLRRAPAIALVKAADISAIGTPPAEFDLITYRFTVTNTGNVTLTGVEVTDPLLGGTVPGGPLTLTPGQSATLAADYPLSQGNLDDGEVINTATAEGTDPEGIVVTDISGTATDNDDPTVTPFVQQPGIALVKAADTSGLGSRPAAGEVIAYSFAVTNTGNVTLSGVTIADLLPGIVLSGGPITLTPGQTDATTFTATYTVTQADIDAGEVVNTATATGTPPTGPDVSDISGTTTGDDDPTLVPLDRQPSIALVKAADASGLGSPPAPGEVIAYSFAVTNTGNVTLNGVTIADLLLGIVLSGGPVTLAPGQTDATTFTATYAVTQADIDAGEVVNTATATGTPPTGPDVSDISGTTTGDDDPTLVPLDRQPGIELVKTADTSGVEAGAEPGDVIPYAFTVTNTGNVTLTGVTITDLLPGLVMSGGPITLIPGQVDATTFTATYAVTPADIMVGTLTNTATVTGTWAGGTVSDDDTVEAVIGRIEALPETFVPFATDGGTTTITMLTSDTLNGQPATLDNVVITVLAADPGVTLDTSTGLITLAPGQPAGPHEVTYRICSAAVPTLCSETVETVVQLPIPGIRAVKTETLVDNGDGVRGAGDRIDYAITVQNTGNVPLTGLTLVDTITTLAGTPLALDSGPTFVSADQGSPAGDLAIGETATYVASHTVAATSVTAGGIENTVTATATEVFGPGVPGTPGTVSDVSDNGIDTDGNTEDDPTVTLFDPLIVASGLGLEKTTPRGVVQRGAAVPYTLTLTNATPTVALVDIVDVLPPGFLYIPGTATLGGMPIDVQVEGRIVTWPSVAIPAQGEIVATLTARVPTGAQPGEHVNRARLLAPDSGAALTPDAQATGRSLPAPAFDCGDVLGKVFDDRNRDGYQNQGEPGLPAVRLAGVDGTIITTDQFGRYHVPCAMLPLDRGSNFILKLDTRSLPAGYRVTTENPRVVRLTPGKMTELNFGASITRVVRMDLSERAFVAGQGGRAEPSAELRAGIATLLPRIAGEPVNLRLAFHLARGAGGEEVRRANGLMDVVERLIREEWRRVGRVKLTIERTLVRED